MKQLRLESLSDGIFSIILTLLTFDLRIPEIPGIVTDQQLWQSLSTLGPTFLSFVLSFAVIFTYWRAHNYIVSVYAKSVDARLTSINALFFFFVALGQYSDTKLSIAIYSANILCIGLSLLLMREYVLRSGNIDHERVTKSELRRGLIRTIVPMVCALAAIMLCVISTKLSFAVLTLAIVFNLMSRSTSFVNWIIEYSAKHLHDE